jgi:hypothetical protein
VRSLNSVKEKPLRLPSCRVYSALYRTQSDEICFLVYFTTCLSVALINVNWMARPAVAVDCWHPHFLTICVSSARQYYALPIVWCETCLCWFIELCALLGYSLKRWLIKKLNHEFYRRLHIIESTFLQILRFTPRSVLQNNTRIFSWSLRAKLFTHLPATIVC